MAEWYSATAPRDAWLAGMIAPDARGRAYGFHRAMDHAGAMIGPLLASAFLFVYPNQLRSLFLWSIVPGLAAGGFIWLARQASRTTPPPHEPAAPETEPFMSVRLKRYMAIVLVFTLGGSSDAFLLLKLSTSGVDNRFIPLIWSGLHVVKSSMSFLGGHLADRIGRTRCIVMGWTWYAMVYLAFGLVNSTALVVTIFLGYGFYYALTESAERALVSEMVPASARGRAFGLQNLIEGLGMLPASLLFGYLWKAHSPYLAFVVSAVFAGTAALLMAIFVREKPAQ
jgi:MFS family permease